MHLLFQTDLSLRWIPSIPFPHLRLRYLPCCVSLCAAALHSPALLGLHRPAPLAVALTCLTQAVAAHLSSVQSVLCWLSLHSPPQLSSLLVPLSLNSPVLLLALSSSSALPAISVCSTFRHFSAGPLQRGAYQFSDYFLLLTTVL